MNNYFVSSNENVVDMDGVFDQRLPEKLNVLKPEDIANNPIISEESVTLLANQLNSFLKQMPEIPQPTFIPSQSVVDKELEDLLQGLSNKSVDASTNTPATVDPLPNDGTCYYLVPKK